MAANKAPDDPAYAETLKAYLSCGENAAETGRVLGISRAAVQNRVKRARASEAPAVAAAASTISLPEFPDDDISTVDIIAHMSKRFQKRKASFDAHSWFEVKVSDSKPIGVLWFGDPHVDDDGCNWPVLTRDAELCRTTPGLYGANIGDSTNNWSDRLVKLYANQDTSVATARKLARWLMLDSGIQWLVYLLGNHDLWGDGATILAQMAKLHGTQKIVCHDWEARFVLKFPNKQEFRIFAAHDFAGHSMWNPLHGPLRASKIGGEADLYVCGHKHNWGVYRYENADRGRIQTVVRARGYKFLDDYARRLGIIEQQAGCAILTVFDPNTGSLLAFDDAPTGADYLTWLRGRS